MNILFIYAQAFATSFARSLYVRLAAADGADTTNGLKIHIFVKYKNIHSYH